MEIRQVLIAFAMALFAGLSTGIGGLLGIIPFNVKRFLPIALGFSAGVMIYVSFMELMKQAMDALVPTMGKKGEWLVVGGFFLGILLIFLIDKLVPEEINPHEPALNTRGLSDKKHDKTKSLKRVGLMTALGITIHNFPEGMATFASGLKDLETGWVVAIAVAIHNIPEGLAVSAPIYHATGSRKKAVGYSFLSGLAEPLGALVAFAIIGPFLNDIVFSVVMAAVSGIMVFISLDELLPTAEKYGEHHWSILGVVLGMAVMALSLLILN